MAFKWHYNAKSTTEQLQIGVETVDRPANAGCITHNHLKPNTVSQKHGIPHSTLKDILSGRVVHGTKPGADLGEGLKGL